MKVRLLGSAAGGGLPQWNCGCATCDEARRHGMSRSQDGIAVSADGEAWFLVNASPDLRYQLMAYPEFQPQPGTRNSPIRGVLLTSAEIDHTLGLLTLREAARLTVYATSTVRDALAFGSVLDAYTAVTWQCIEPHQPVSLDAGLTTTAFAVGAKRPRFADAAIGRDWTVAYLFTDARTGGRLIYAPGLAHWQAEFTALLGSADVVILDGTFATATEMAPADIGAMGHLPIEETLPLIKANPGPSYVYTHLNNTNPMALAGDRLSESLHAAGARIASDGDLFDV